METGYRVLRDAYIRRRLEGVDFEAAQAELGFRSSRVESWELKIAEVLRDGDRHHLQHDAAVENLFWDCYASTLSASDAAKAAGIGRSTAYRWLRGRFFGLRDQGCRRAAVAATLGVDAVLAARWDQARASRDAGVRRRLAHVDRQTLRRARRHAAEGEYLSGAQKRRAERDTRYWQLLGSGLTNTQACKILGVSRRTGTLIRRRRSRQGRAGSQRSQLRPAAAVPGSAGTGSSSTCSRYLTLAERTQIADLRRLGRSIRQIAAELARPPSTVKRELDRNRDQQGRYLPHAADAAATARRRRPRPSKLAGNPRLRRTVQRKLNRCWSPEQIAGWLRRRHPDDPAMQLCHETIYQALLKPTDSDGVHHGALDKRYCAKLRTGRRVRRERWRTQTRKPPAVQDMTPISARPAHVSTNAEAGHWEGDLIVGTSSMSAMVTLRERKTQYGIVVNLPDEHTAVAVNTAVATAFADLPAHLKKTLTWDQGVEMARHRDLAAATGIAIYFADRCSPWQRGANENYNGLLRQYFPKATDLSVHTPEHVRHVVDEVNSRPRKKLGYRTPAQLFQAEKRRQPRQDTPTPRPLR
jgi:transposase, IS30 family